MRELDEFDAIVECRCPKALVEGVDRSVSLELALFVDISLFVVFQVFEFAEELPSSGFILTLLSTFQTRK